MAAEEAVAVDRAAAVASPVSVRPFAGVGGSSTGYSMVLQVQYVDNTPELLQLVIPVQAEWLKEFYDVSMTVTNLGSSGFTLTGGSAQLQLPVAPDGPAPWHSPALRDRPAGAAERCGYPGRWLENRELDRAWR